MKLHRLTKIVAHAIWLLLLEFNPTHCDDVPNDQACQGERQEWKSSRAVHLAENLKLKAVRWMNPALSHTYDSNCTNNGNTTGGDSCQEATIAVHHYKVGKDNIPIIISDLSLALKCENGKCVCAENNTKYDAGIKRCLKANQNKGDECIHQQECKDGNVCVFNPRVPKKKLGNCGEIDDLRRFCSGSGIALPSAVLMLAFIHPLYFM